MRGSFVIAIFFVLIWYGFFRQYTLQATETMAGSATYICNGGTSINAFFYEKSSPIYLDGTGTPLPQGKVEIALNDGRSFSLPQVTSSSGFQYVSSDQSFTFWTNGNKATVSENGVKSNYWQCIRIANQLPGSNLSRVYVDNAGMFSLRLPTVDVSNQDTYVANSEYTYKFDNGLKKISGTSFSIPVSRLRDTRVLKETYISIEFLPDVKRCVASEFFNQQGVVDLYVTENDVSYSVASSVSEKAGVYFEEVVYAISDTSPCAAVRYFIAEDSQLKVENKVDKSSLRAEFDQIRHSLILAN